MGLRFELKKLWKYSAIGVFASLTLVGCSNNPNTSTAKSEPNYTLTLKISPNDSQAALEAKYQGKALLWDEQAGVAVFTVMDKPTGVSAQAVGLESNARIFSAGAELANSGTSRLWAGGSSQFWAGGSSQFWAGGSSQFWAGGSSQFWAGGVFTPMMQNTTAWQQIRLEQAQSMTSNLGYGVKVAVIDTGIDLNHPAFQGALVPGSEMWDYVGGDAVPQEEGSLADEGYGHGTNVAGIIRQIAPRATILPIRILDRDGRGTVADLVSAIDWAVSKGASVINLSLGSNQISFAVGAALISATYKGVLVVSSSGNTGDTNVTYPASVSTWYKQRISVASVDPSNVKSSFSTYGKTIEVAAPGELVYAPAPDNRMMAWSGTSMSAAIVSGGAALALGEPLKVSKTDLLNNLMTSATGIYGLAGNANYKDQLGGGTLNLERFLKQVL